MNNKSVFKTILYVLIACAPFYILNAQGLKLKKRSINIPNFKEKGLTSPQFDIKTVKPVLNTTNIFFKKNTDNASLEQITDEAILYLYRLAKKYKNDRDRADIWLRLARQYWEKARIVKAKIYSYYHKGEDVFSTKKRRFKNIDFSPAHRFNKKSLKLYTQFLSIFKKDNRRQEVLLYAARNYIDLRDINQAVFYHNILQKEFPRSSFLEGLRFLIGDYYFENYQWAKASRFYILSLNSSTKQIKAVNQYKLAWLDYKLGRYQKAYSLLRKVIQESKSKNNIVVYEEAVKDFPYFYSRVGSAHRAYFHLSKYIKDKKSLYDTLEILSGYYFNAGRSQASVFILKELIKLNPLGAQSFEFQRKIISILLKSGKASSIQKELSFWVKNYGIKSQWVTKNPDIAKEKISIQKKFFKVYILRSHSNFKRKKFVISISQVLELYELYFNNFYTSYSQGVVDDPDMFFYYVDTLFDIKKYKKAEKVYLYFLNAKAKYYQESLYAMILLFQERLASYNQLKKKTNGFTRKIKLNSNDAQFAKYSKKYIEEFLSNSKSENIIKKLGIFYYNRLHLKKAEKFFLKFLNVSKKSSSKKEVVQFLVDIYNQSNQFKSIEVLAKEYPVLAKAQSFRGVLNKIQLKRAESAEQASNYTEATSLYKKLSVVSQYSNLAHFNRGVIFLKQKLWNQAIQSVSKVNRRDKELYKKSQDMLLDIYTQLGMYPQLAQHLFKSASSQKLTKKKEYYYNSFLIWRGLRYHKSALRALAAYQKISSKREKVNSYILQAEIYKQMKNNPLAITFYKKYFWSDLTNQKQKLKIAYKLYILYKDQKKISFWKNQILKLYNSRLFKTTDLELIEIVQEIKFQLPQKTYLRLLKLGVSKRQKREVVLKKKIQVYEKLKLQLKDIASHSTATPSLISALVLQAQGLRHLAQFIELSPVPKVLSAADKKIYIRELKKTFLPMKQEAEKLLALALDKSIALDLYSPLLPKIYQERGYIEFLKGHTSLGSAQILYPKESLLSGNQIKARAMTFIQEDPKAFEPWMLLAWGYFKSNQKGVSLIILNEMIKKKKLLHFVYNDLVLYTDHFKYREAISAYKQSLDYKNTFIARWNLGSLYLDHYATTKALPLLSQSFVKIANYSPQRGDLLNYYGVSLRWAGKLDKSKDIYTKVLSQDSQNVFILFNYAVLAIKYLKDKSLGGRLIVRLELLNRNALMRSRVLKLKKRIGK